MQNLALNPFLWQGVVFLLFGLVTGVSVSALYGFPKRLLEGL